ncbi:MAG: YedE-related selenium metabolism membrane protein [Nitrospirae bacterium]|nr:YedE-related selenium metabolism membrane protein [Nitrospirota bacterium]
MQYLKQHKEILTVILAGAVIGGLGMWLAYMGNPRNSGICVSCFMENLAGAMGLHGNARMQYIRPELAGFVLGGTAAAFLAREFRSEGGSSPLIRFMAGALLIVGCSVFLGCPIKMSLRVSAGDLTALAGVGGLVFGIWLGYVFLRRGFYLGDSVSMPRFNGLVIPLLMAGLLGLLLIRPEFLYISDKGPAAQRAPILISLGVGLLAGFLAQRSRFCVTGGIGNFMVSGDKGLLSGVISMIAFAFLVSLMLGQFSPGVEGQPGSHLSYGWSFAGMALVGLTSILIGGCPFRQLVLAGQGSTDAGAAVLGMVAGGALVQSWGLTSSNLGPTNAGEVATLLGLAFVLILGIVMRVRD